MPQFDDTLTIRPPPCSRRCRPTAFAIAKTAVRLTSKWSFHVPVVVSNAAIEFFKEGRELAGNNRSRELYATQRLIDLYLGPLGDDVRALVELRRLVERFPGTKEAAAARNVLMRMKATVRLDA